MKTKQLGILAATLIAIGAAWYVSQDKAPQTDVKRDVFFADLIDRVNEVRSVTLRSAEHESRLERAGEQWTLANRDGFAANGADAKRTILQIAGLRAVEAKTASPDRYARLGVSDIDAEDADGTRVTLADGDGQVLADVIVGHAREAGSVRDQHYVRQVGDAQSWLVAGELEAPADPIRWLDASIVDIDTARVRKVTITAPDTAAVQIVKAERNDNFFALEDIPDGFEAKSKATVSSLGALLLDLRLNDVAAAEKVAGMTPAREVEVVTFDGIVATLREYAVDDAFWVGFEFAHYDSLAVADDGGDADATDDESTADAGGDTAGAATETPADEASRWAERTTGWVYALPNYKRRMYNRTLDSLIKAIEEEDAE